MGPEQQRKLWWQNVLLALPRLGVSSRLYSNKATLDNIVPDSRELVVEKGCVVTSPGR